MSMKIKLHLIAEWLKQRIQEPSTRIAIVTLVSFSGFKLSPEYQEFFIQGGVLLASFVALITSDPQSAESKEGHAENVEAINDVSVYALESTDELHARIDELEAMLRGADLLGDAKK